MYIHWCHSSLNFNQAEIPKKGLNKNPELASCKMKKAAVRVECQLGALICNPFGTCIPVLMWLVMGVRTPWWWCRSCGMDRLGIHYHCKLEVLIRTSFIWSLRGGSKYGSLANWCILYATWCTLAVSDLAICPVHLQKHARRDVYMIIQLLNPQISPRVCRWTSSWGYAYAAGSIKVPANRPNHLCTVT